MKTYLTTLACKDPNARRQALVDILEKEHFTYTTQTEGVCNTPSREIINFLLEPADSSPSLLFCAHYDAVPGSFGANDNAAALCILIKLAAKLRELNIPARFAFFDGEEIGNAGSQLYVSQIDPQTITGVINLDLCGFGDTLAIYSNGNERKNPLLPFCHKNILKKHHGQLVKYLPPSDHNSFLHSGIPAMSISVVPYWDIKFLKTLASMGSGLLGRTPEFDLIINQMEVTSTIHGGSRDNPEWIDEKAMESVYQYLLDGIFTSPVHNSAFFSFFQK